MIPWLPEEYAFPPFEQALTDPNGLVSADLQRVSDAGKRYEDATGGGWMWNVVDVIPDMSCPPRL